MKNGIFYKVETAEKKRDYAERVKERNRIILAEQKASEPSNLSVKSSVKESKSQRVIHIFILSMSNDLKQSKVNEF